MKKLLIVSVHFLWSNVLTAQVTMIIHHNDGATNEFNIANIDSITYSNNPTSVPASMNTIVNYITGNQAVASCVVVSAGGLPIESKGFCWATSPNPTFSDNHVICGSGSSSFSCSLLGLNSNTLYYVRSFVTTCGSTVYGTLSTFTTTNNCCIDTLTGSGVIDIDGNAYASIIYGNGQEWMKSNLRTTRYSNGDPIPNETNVANWQNLNSGAWAHYQNNNVFEVPYGKLYNWFASSDERNLCPIGWRVPDYFDFKALLSYIDPSFEFDDEVVSAGNIGTDAGIKMKVPGNSYWLPPNDLSNNSSGFSGLPSGQLFAEDAQFNDLGTFGYWGTSSSYPFDNVSICIFGLWHDNNGAYFDGDGNKFDGNSIRCIKE